MPKIRLKKPNPSQFWLIWVVVGYISMGGYLLLSWWRSRIIHDVNKDIRRETNIQLLDFSLERHDDAEQHLVYRSSRNAIIRFFKNTFILQIGLVILAATALLLLRQEKYFFAVPILGVCFYLIRKIFPSKQPTSECANSKIKFRRIQVILAAVSICIAIFISFRVNSTNLSNIDFILNIVLWILSITIFAVAILLAGNKIGPIDLGKNLYKLLIPAGVFILSFVIRFLFLKEHPYAFTNDEGWVGIEAVRILSGETKNLFGVGWAGQPLLSFVPTVFPIILFGNSVQAVRIVSVLEGSLSVVFLYYFVKENFSHRAGILSSVVLMVMPVHNHFSRTGFNNITPAFFAAFGFWQLLKGIRQGKPKNYLLGGIIIGAALYSYVGSRLVILLALLIVGWAIITVHRFFVNQWRNLVIFSLACLLTISPMMVWFAVHPLDFTARLGTESIFTNDWVESDANRLAIPKGQVMVNQLVKSTLVFISQPASISFYNSPKPYLSFLASMFFLIGFGIIVFQVKRIEYFAIFAWYWAPVIFGGMLTSSAPQNQRLVMSLPAAAAFVGIGIDWTFSAIQKQAKMRVFADLILAAIIAVIAIQGISFYFGEYRTNQYFSDFSDEFIYETSVKAINYGKNTKVALLSRPMADSNFPNYKYLLNGYDRSDVEPESEGEIAIVFKNHPVFFAATPDHMEDLLNIRLNNPGGKWETIFRKGNRKEVLYYSYYLP